MEATAASAVAAASGLVALQMCSLLLLRAPQADAKVVAGAVGRPPVASLQRLSEAEWDSYHEVDHLGPGTYAFGYDVEDPESGNTQFRQEERYPNGTVSGSYGLVLPDGSVQIVHYTADELGYRARIETKPPSHRAHIRPTAAAPPIQHAFPGQAAAFPSQATAFPVQAAAFPVQAATFRPPPPRAFASQSPPVRSYAGLPPSGTPPSRSAARAYPEPQTPTPESYSSVFWLPAPAAPQPFAINYV